MGRIKVEQERGLVVKLASTRSVYVHVHSAFPSVARSDRPDGRPASTAAGGWGGADAEPALDAYATQACMHACMRHCPAGPGGREQLA